MSEQYKWLVERAMGCPAIRGSGGLLGLVMEDQKLVFRDGELGVGAALVIGEFDFKHTRCQGLNDRANLAAQQPLVGQIAGDGNNIKRSNFVSHNGLLQRGMPPTAGPCVLHPRDRHYVEGVDRLNFYEITKIGVVEGQKFGNPVLDHQRHDAYIMAAFAPDCIFGNKAFP